MNKERTSTPDLHGQTGDTLRIRRPPRIFTTDLGKNVWMGDVEPPDFELELEQPVSTNPYDRNSIDSGVDDSRAST